MARRRMSDQSSPPAIAMVISVAFSAFLLTAFFPSAASSKKVALQFYLQQQFGVNELQMVAAARPAVAPSVTGFGLEVVYEYPAFAGPPNATTSPAPPFLGFVRGTSVVVNNTANTTTFFVTNVVHFDNGKLSGTFTQQGEASFNSGNPWELAVTGGTGDFRSATGYNVGQFYASIPTNASRIIITKYNARLSI